VVEPFASYTVGRLQKDWDKGNTSLGAMFTSSHRWPTDSGPAFLPTQATTGGVDFSRYFGNRTWVFDGRGFFSRVAGDAAAIMGLQTNAVHYYQRVGATHLGVDEGRTSLSGHGGSVRFGRSENSRLRLLGRIHWYSPGLDFNEIGYLRQADLISNQVFLGWSETTPGRVLREYSVQAGREDGWDFGGLKTEARTSVVASGQFQNKWRVNGSLSFQEAVDTRALRGGPAMRLSDALETTLGFGTDSSRRLVFSTNAVISRALEGGSRVSHVSGGLRVRPSNRLSLNANLGHMRSTDDLQYVTTANGHVSDGSRWVLGRIDQEVWSLTLRANLSITPELTVQYYGSPFIATGRYASFKSATDTLAGNYEDRFHEYRAGEISYFAPDDLYKVAEAGGPTYSFANPDFSFLQFRSNLVARWEWKPGSSLYLVWSQGRTGASSWEGSLRGNWGGLWSTRPDNTLLVKMAYWISP
jgi:hypothetical protein